MLSRTRKHLGVAFGRVRGAEKRSRMIDGSMHWRVRLQPAAAGLRCSKGCSVWVAERSPGQRSVQPVPPATHTNSETRGVPKAAILGRQYLRLPGRFDDLWSRLLFEWRGAMLRQRLLLRRGALLSVSARVLRRKRRMLPRGDDLLSSVRVHLARPMLLRHGLCVRNLPGGGMHRKPNMCVCLRLHRGRRLLPRE